MRPPAEEPSNLCSIFSKKRLVRKRQESAAALGIPVPIQLAIINQESSFIEDARPPRYRLCRPALWRPSSAYGYGQVTDGTGVVPTKPVTAEPIGTNSKTWSISSAGMPSKLPESRLSKLDAYNQYLAYHEGHGGFRRKSYLSAVVDASGSARRGDCDTLPSAIADLSNARKVFGERLRVAGRASVLAIWSIAAWAQRKRS